MVTVTNASGALRLLAAEPLPGIKAEAAEAGDRVGIARGVAWVTTSMPATTGDDRTTACPAAPKRGGANGPVGVISASLSAVTTP